jgi:hypothetical protein
MQMDPDFEERRASAYLANLQKERAGYVARDLPERVKAVDAEIARVKKAKRITPAKAEVSEGDPAVETPAA